MIQSTLSSTHSQLGTPATLTLCILVLTQQILAGLRVATRCCHSRCFRSLRFALPLSLSRFRSPNQIPLAPLRETARTGSYFTLRRIACVGGQQRASVVTPPGLSPFWHVRTRGCARWRPACAARPALRQSHGVSHESPDGWLWRSAGLWDGRETLRDASEAVYTKEPMVDVGAWDIGGRDS